MSPDHLTLPVGEVATRVEALLAGSAPTDDVDLADAIETYRAAGRAALQRNQDRTWFQARVTPANWANAEKMFAAEIMPRFDQLDGAPDWWFLRKHPDWRLRVRTTDHQVVEALLGDLTTAGIIAGWRPSIYEPETAAFGGRPATTIVHNLFSADSRGVLTYARQDAPGLGRRELSLLLIRALQQHSGLDWYEAGDVFDRVAHTRPTPNDADIGRADVLATKMRPLLAIPIQADSPLFAAGGLIAHAAPWLTGHIDAGRRLREAAETGHLQRGLRAILAHVVIFHWNRLGLSAEAQGVLAYAAKAAILPRS